jgi:oligosaccharide repeat unit polymerase
VVTFIGGILCAFALLLYVGTRPGSRRAGVYLPDFYIATLLTYSVGAIFTYVSGDYVGDEQVVLMSELALLTGSVGAFLGALALSPSYPADYGRQNLAVWQLGRGEEAAIYGGLVVSGLACLIFIVAIVRNGDVSYLLWQAFSVDQSGTLLEARKTITNGTSGYFAPGFVKQFRDILVPILTCAVILVASRQRIRFSLKVIVLGITVVAAVAMLLTGVRSTLFLFFIALFIARALAQRAHQLHNPQHKKRRQLVFLVIALLVYGVLTVLLGRVSGDEGYGTQSLHVFLNLVDRVIMAAPRENMMSFPFWSGLGPTHGHYWLIDLRGILPGAGEVSLSNLLHEYNGGSIEGNSSPGLPVDVWLNSGWPGLAVVPVLYGLFLCWFDLALTRLRSPIAFGTKVVLALALLQIYTPFGFVLYGGLASLMLYAWLKIVHRQRRPHAKTSTYVNPPRYSSSSSCVRLR